MLSRLVSTRFVSILLIALALGWAVLAIAQKAGSISDSQTGVKPDTPALEVTRIVEAVRGYYQKAGDFSATFSQAYHSKLTRRVTESGGKVDFAQPMKMRWEYDSPDRKTFVTDGKTLWVANWKSKDVSVRKNLKSSQLESSLAFLWGGGDLAADYRIARLELANVEGVAEVNGRQVLELLPKKPNQFEALYLILNATTSAIEETVLVDAVGNRNHLTFKDLKPKQTYPEGHFRLQLPGKDWTEKPVEF